MKCKIDEEWQVNCRFADWLISYSDDKSEVYTDDNDLLELTVSR